MQFFIFREKERGGSVGIPPNERRSLRRHIQKIGRERGKREEVSLERMRNGAGGGGGGGRSGFWLEWRRRRRGANLSPAHISLPPPPTLEKGERKLRPIPHITLCFFIFPGHHPAPAVQVAVRVRVHLHHLVQARSPQRRQHREGEAVPLLV